MKIGLSRDGKPCVAMDENDANYWQFRQTGTFTMHVSDFERALTELLEKDALKIYRLEFELDQAKACIQQTKDELKSYEAALAEIATTMGVKIGFKEDSGKPGHIPYSLLPGIVTYLYANKAK